MNWKIKIDMNENIIEEVVGQQFVFVGFSYTKFKLKDAVDICKSFQRLFPQPYFYVVGCDDSVEVKLEGLTKALTTLRFDFDYDRFYSLVKSQNKSYGDTKKILCFYYLPENQQKLFRDLGLYLLNLNSPDWRENLGKYAE